MHFVSVSYSPAIASVEQQMCLLESIMFIYRYRKSMLGLFSFNTLVQTFTFTFTFTYIHATSTFRHKTRIMDAHLALI